MNDSVNALITRVTELLKLPLQIDQVSDEHPHQWLIYREGDDNPHEFAAHLSLEEDEADPDVLNVTPTADYGGPGEYHDDPGYVEINDEEAAEVIVSLAESYLTDGPARDPQWWLAAGKGRFSGPHPVTPIGIVAAHTRATRPDLDVGWRDEDWTLVVSLDRGHEQQGPTLGSVGPWPSSSTGGTVDPGRAVRLPGPGRLQDGL